MSASFLAKRYGNFQPFVGVESTDEDRTWTGRIGFVTYQQHEDAPETYQVTSINYGARADHLATMIADACGDEYPQCSVDSPVGQDAQLLRKPDAEKKTQKVPAKSSAEKPADAAVSAA